MDLGGQNIGMVRRRQDAAERWGPRDRDEALAELERETVRWRERAERAEALVEVQKKLAVLLGAPLEAERS